MYSELFLPFVGTKSKLTKQIALTNLLQRAARGVGETAPRYLDEEYASATPEKTIIADPTYTFTLDYGEFPGFSFPSKGIVHANHEYTYYKPIHSGDVLYCQREFLSSEEKTGRSGVMVFVKIKESVMDEDMQPYCVAVRTQAFLEKFLKGFDPTAPAEPEQRAKTDDKDNSAIIISACKVGDQLPVIVYPAVTRGDIARYCGVMDHYDILHVDDEAAQKVNYKAIIAHGMMSMGILSRAIEEWIAAPAGKLIDYSCKFLQPTYPGDELHCSGDIAKIEKCDGFSRLTLNVRANNQEDGKLLEGKAVVEVPEA